MKITIDLRSALIGLVAGVLLMFTLGAAGNSGIDGNPRYQVAGTHSHAVIVNTATGQAWSAFMSPNSGPTDPDFKAAKLR